LLIESDAPIIAAEDEEVSRLERVKSALRGELLKVESNLEYRKSELDEMVKYHYEHNLHDLNKADLTIGEVIESERVINQAADAGERDLRRRREILKLLDSAYFGRIDFTRSGFVNSKDFYIGAYTFINPESGEILVYDWRAPVSEMFYENKLGPATYTAPAGVVTGVVNNKRQYHIRAGVLEYFFDTAVNVDDEILQRELSGLSDDRLKTIIETIQQEQNAVIRGDAETLIIQGAAGSGKTSIALHRAAYLLYKYKDTLTSKNILVLSPNRVFSDYISAVLPELGEDSPIETTAEEIAEAELTGIGEIESRYEQTMRLIESKHGHLAERVKFKSTIEFVRALDSFCQHIGENYVELRDVTISGVTISKEFMEKRFKRSGKHPIMDRLQSLADAIHDELRASAAKHPSWLHEAFKEAVLNFLKPRSYLRLYEEFLKSLGKPNLYVRNSGKVEYADVYPLLRIKDAIDGLESYKTVKHLIIDEMQDYTPAEYDIFKRLFKCPVTILGDKNQSASLVSGSTAETIAAMYENPKVVTLNRSYRSTYEISAFANSIQPADNFDCFERHGEPPEIIEAGSRQREVEALIDRIKSRNPDGSAAVICKTRRETASIYNALQDKITNLQLLDENSVMKQGKVIVTTAAMAKGLEFDEVIIPSLETYSDSVSDKRLLYIACTRAMHKLTLIKVSHE